MRGARSPFGLRSAAVIGRLRARVWPGTGVGCLLECRSGGPPWAAAIGDAGAREGTTVPRTSSTRRGSRFRGLTFSAVLPAQRALGRRLGAAIQAIHRGFRGGRRGAARSARVPALASGLYGATPAIVEWSKPGCASSGARRARARNGRRTVSSRFACRCESSTGPDSESRSSRCRPPPSAACITNSRARSATGPAPSGAQLVLPRIQRHQRRGSRRARRKSRRRLDSVGPVRRHHPLVGHRRVGPRLPYRDEALGPRPLVASRPAERHPVRPPLQRRPRRPPRSPPHPPRDRPSRTARAPARTVP